MQVTHDVLILQQLLHALRCRNKCQPMNDEMKSDISLAYSLLISRINLAHMSTHVNAYP